MTQEEMIKQQMEAARPDFDTHVGMFVVQSANATIQAAALRPDPLPLWLNLWMQGETCCCFADSNVGKSAYVVQMCVSIADTQKVLYFDFELSDKQFQRRYTDLETGELYTFPANFYRVAIDPQSLNVTEDFEAQVMNDIEAAALQFHATVIIIDNLTWLCAESEKGDAAGRLMISLLRLKMKYGWSLLVLAHTPKRNLANPITQNDLAGSKKLFNLFDSVFSIGFSAIDQNLRYVKQLKVRDGAFEYGKENVIVYELAKEGCFLGFRPLGFAPEAAHLQEPKSEAVEAQMAEIKRLKENHLSVREIADALGLAKSTVQRKWDIIRKAQNQ